MSLCRPIVLSALATLVAASVAAGPVGGPVRHADLVAGQDFVVFTVRIDSGRSVFGLRGDGSTDLDLFLFELDGTLIEGSESASDRERISRWFGDGRTIVVAVVNLGRRSSPFVLTID